MHSQVHQISISLMLSLIHMLLDSMESDEESRSSSNSSASSASSTNGPASPVQAETNGSNEQTQEAPAIAVEDTKDSEKKDDEEELELSDVEDESQKNEQKADISHEDLSDISDLESNSPSNNFTDLRQKLDKQRMNGSGKNDKVDDDDDELDFEADEESTAKKLQQSSAKSEKSEKEDGEEEENSDGGLEEGEELEDGEVTDGDEKRPEESEPKAVCRFYTRGQCTWGMSCRFLHPGTTDKGNYTMFDMVRPIPVPQNVPMPVFDYRNERPNHFIPPHVAPHFAGHARPPVAAPIPDSESAWERGLRTAKEMIRKSNKRKEQDVDFDEKKMNLSGPVVDEAERDPYYAARASPEVSLEFEFKRFFIYYNRFFQLQVSPSFERLPRERPRYLPPSDFSPPAKFHRGAPPAHYEEDAFGRAPRYRELPAHRMPHYEDDEDTKRRVRTNREVIVRRPTNGPILGSVNDAEAAVDENVVVVDVSEAIAAQVIALRVAAVDHGHRLIHRDLRRVVNDSKITVQLNERENRFVVLVVVVRR